MPRSLQIQHIDDESSFVAEDDGRWFRNFRRRQQQRRRPSSSTLRPRYLAILYDALLGLGDVDVTTLKEKGEAILQNGVFLKDKKSFYWLIVTEDKSYLDCYFVLASSLTFSDQYDSWVKEVEPVPKPSRSEPAVVVNVEVPKLVKSVRWLEVKGSFNTVNLQLGTDYNVSFRVKVSDTAGFPKGGLPVEFSLVLPGLYSRQEIINYKTIAYNDPPQWTDVLVGKFSHDYQTIGTMYFSMKNTDATWKGGISVMGVCIMPSDANHTKNILDWKPYKL